MSSSGWNLRKAVLAGAATLTIVLSGATATQAATVTRTGSVTDPGTSTASLVRAGDALQLPPPTYTEPFDGTALATHWQVLPHDATAGFLAQPSGGSLHLDGAGVVDSTAIAPGADVQFTATLGNAAYTSVGLAANLDPGPFAVFSTGPDGTGVYVTTNDGHDRSLPLRLSSSISPSVAHTYRIAWTATGFTFFVDGQQVGETGPILDASAGLHLYANDAGYQDPVPGSSPPQVAAALSVDAITMRAENGGTFTSAPIDAGPSRVTAATLVPTATTPAGTQILYATRSAATADDLSSVPFTAVGADGSVQGATGRFLQFRATLVDDDLTLTPTFTSAAVAFTVGPTVAVDVGVVGAHATVAFTTGDATDAVLCRLDDGPFGPCSSPAAYAGLAAGSHTVTVQATDTAGTVGTATRSFTVTAPTTTVGAPAVTGSSVAVPLSTDDPYASVTCRIDDGAYASCASPARYTGLTAGSHTVTVQATDATDVGTASQTFTIAAPHVTVGSAAIDGTTATVPFVSDDPTGHVECQLDHAAFAACASPARFTGLAAGSHTVTVRATDTSGEASAGRTFTIPRPAGPKVGVRARSLRISARGTLPLVISCPKSTRRCAATVTLGAFGTTVARGSEKVIRGGDAKTLTLRLTKAARAKLAAHSHLKVTAVVVAKDPAGDQHTTVLVMTLRRASR